jgi:hypothetical protein
MTPHKAGSCKGAQALNPVSRIALTGYTGMAVKSE